MQSNFGLCIAFEHHVFLYITCAEEITAENVLGYILRGSLLSYPKRNRAWSLAWKSTYYALLF